MECRGWDPQWAWQYNYWSRWIHQLCFQCCSVSTFFRWRFWKNHSHFNRFWNGAVDPNFAQIWALCRIRSPRQRTGMLIAWFLASLSCSLCCCTNYSLNASKNTERSSFISLHFSNPWRESICSLANSQSPTFFRRSVLKCWWTASKPAEATVATAPP